MCAAAPAYFPGEPPHLDSTAVINRNDKPLFWAPANAGPRAAGLSSTTLAVPSRTPLPPGYAKLPKKPRYRPRPVNSKMIEACSYAMHKIGGTKVGRLCVVSSVRGEGRTSIATAMAYVHARDYGRSTLLLDADFDGPQLASMFGLPPSPGVEEVLRGRAGIDEAIHQVDDGLTVMPAGDVVGSPSRLAKELASSNLLEELQADYEVIIADLPALLQSASGALLADMFDTTVMVVRAGVTPMPKVREAVSALRAEPIVMLNGTTSSLPYWLRRFFA